MIELNVLGRSHATISMIVETLHKIYRDRVRIKIIGNILVEDELPFAIEGIRIIEVFHEDWNYRSDIDRQVQCISGVYGPATKRKVFSFFRTHYQIGLQNYANLIHPSVQLAATTQLKKGLNIGPNTAIAPYAIVGNMVSVNRGVTIGHHTVISDYCTINPGSNIAGRCKIGESVTIGMGSNVVDGVHIGDKSIVGAGALVTKDVPPNVVVYGAPAQVARPVS
jgi:sugar O-acyltransferase (sialic acid O-acetyltransferase NeuD family)